MCPIAPSKNEDMKSIGVAVPRLAAAPVLPGGPAQAAQAVSSRPPVFLGAARVSPRRIRARRLSGWQPNRLLPEQTRQDPILSLRWRVYQYISYCQRTDRQWSDMQRLVHTWTTSGIPDAPARRAGVGTHGIGVCHRA